MASISAMLSDLADFPENHPYLAEALPTIAGAVLMARRGRNGQPTTIGAPLGAGLLAGGQLLGDYAAQQATKNQTAKSNKLLAQTFGAKPLPLPDFITQGGSVKDYFDAHPELKTKQPAGIKPISVPGSPLGYVDDKGVWHAVSGAPTVPNKLEKVTPYDDWKKEHPNGTVEEYADFTAKEKLKGEKPDKPEKPRETLWAPPGGGPPMIVNLDTGISRALPGLAGRPPTGSAPKTVTAAQALANVKSATTSAIAALGKTGYGTLGFSGPPPGAIKAAVHDTLANTGLSDTGYPLKDGQKVKLSNGKIVVWHND